MSLTIKDNGSPRPTNGLTDNPLVQGLSYRLAEQFSEQTNKCLFVTGKAGTGKTTFLRRLQKISNKNMAVVAPTGVAAINAGGMTIHSFFQLPIRTLIPTAQSYNQMFAEQRMVQRKRNMLYHLEMLVIDEISMVRADVLDAIDAVLRHYRFRRDEPFGGVQVVMIGDLMQLSPVVHGDDGIALSKYYDGPYFFQSRVMQQIQPVYIELDHVFRQQNKQFVELLNEVRDNRLTDYSRNLLASRYLPNFVNKETDDFHITLTTHNQQADELNQRKLGELNGKLYTFKAEVFMNFPESSYPTDELLHLKEGARVMFIRNDDRKPRRFYNGKLGVISLIGKDTIVVRSEDGDIEVEPMQWENIRYREDETTGRISEELLGAFRQYPLRLAWAITIHKSQGLTFDRVIIDAARAFASGQVYVALSRCRTLEGIVLSSPLKDVSLYGDKQVSDFLQLQPSPKHAECLLDMAQREYMAQLFTDLYSLARPLTLIDMMLKHAAKCVSFNQETHPFLENRRTEINTLLAVTDKFQQQLKKILLTTANNCSLDTDTVNSDNEYLKERLEAAAGYFVPRLKKIANAISSHPCKCKNKQDAADFDSMMNDLFLVLEQKTALMQAVAKEPTTEALLMAKKRFVLPPMQTQSVFDKPAPKTKRKQSNGKQLAHKVVKPKKEPRPLTREQTYELYRAGYTPEQIAEKRGLKPDTIFEHLAKYVEQGHILITDLVPEDIINRILLVRTEHPDFTTLREFHKTLNEEIPFIYIRMVLTAYNLL